MTNYLETKVDKFTFKVANDRFYSDKGIWALSKGSIVRIGLSDFVQQRSGDIAFADVKPAGTVLAAGDEAGAIETIKVNITIVSPVAGKIMKVNPLMETTPETINQDAFGEGWLCEIEATNWEADRKNLLDATSYFNKMKQEAENEVKKDD